MTSSQPAPVPALARTDVRPAEPPAPDPVRRTVRRAVLLVVALVAAIALVAFGLVLALEYELLPGPLLGLWR